MSGKADVIGPDGGEADPERTARMLAILEDYVGALERGESPDPASLLARHPDLADALADYLASLDCLHRAAVGLRHPGDFRCEDRIGDFRILREIGRGGMGVVFEAEQVSLGRRVALKVLPFAAVLDQRQLQRFRNEAQAAAQLHHPHIVPVHAVGCDRDVHFYAMQHVAGRTLAEVIDELRSGRGAGVLADSPTADESSSRRAFFRTAARLGAEAASALEHAHSMGVIHRDIKPANLLVDIEGHLWVTDFGLARVQSDPGLTASGDLVGTLRYMSPEQALGRSAVVDPRADVYALGATLYELVTLEPAVPGRDREEVLRRIAAGEPRPPRRLNPSIPTDLETIVLEAMAKEPGDRYATAADLAADLERFLEDRPIRASRPSLAARAVRWSRRHRAVVTAAVALLFLAATGFAASTLLIWREKERTTAFFLEAKSQRQRAEELLARSQLERGVRRLEEGDALGLLDLVEARRTAEESPGLRKRIEEVWAVWHRVHSGRLVRVIGQKGPATAAAFSPDGQLVATSSEDGAVAIWRTDSWTPARSPFDLGAPVRVLVFSPSGDLLAAGGEDGAVRIWQLHGGEPLAVPVDHGDEPIEELLFNPAGDLLVSLAGATVRVWRPGAASPVCETSSADEVLSVAISPDGGLLAVGLRRSAQLLAVDSCRPTGRPLATAGKAVLVKYGPRGRFLATATGSTVRLWDVETRRQFGPPLENRRTVLDVAFSPDGETIASCSLGRTVRLWETATGEPRGEPLAHEDRVTGIRFSPDGSILLSWSRDRTARLWNIESGEPHAPPFPHPGSLRGASFSPDGSLVASVSDDGSTRIWKTASALRSSRAHARAVRDIAFSPDDAVLATASQDWTAVLWDLETGEPRAPSLFHLEWVNAVAFSPGGKIIATASDDATVGVWSANDGQPIRALAHEGRVRAVAFARDETLVASTDRRILRWDPHTGKQIGDPIEIRGGIRAVAFEQATDLLAAGLQDRSVRIVDMASGSIQAAWPTHRNHITALAFGRQGALLASGSEDGTARVLSIADAASAGGPLHHPGRVLDAAFHPRGDLLTTGTSGEVRLWSLAGAPPWHAAILELPGETRALAFDPQGRRLAAGTSTGQAVVWLLPEPPGSIEEMAMRTEVALAARVDESGEVRALPWREWEELRQAIEALGEPPVRPPLLLERSRDPDRDTVELLEGMSARAPWASEYRWRLARLLKRRGELRRRNGEIADAIGDFERSVGLLENLRAPMPGEDYLRELGLTYDALCDACAAGRRLPRAAETHGKLVKFLRSIPPDPSVADYYLLLARKSGPLANLLESEGRASAGARVRADATGLLEAIVTAFPGNREYRLEYARALCALARAIEIRSGHEERTDATTARRKAISIYDELLAESPAPFDCRSERDACAAPASAALESSEAR